MTIQIGYLPQVLLLVLTRVCALLFTVPFFGGRSLPVRARAAIAMLLTLVLLPVLPQGWVLAAKEIKELPELLAAMLSQALYGIAVGLVCGICVASVSVAGLLAGRGSSLMMAQQLDPLGGNQNTIMVQVLNMLFILVVVLADGHLAILRLFARSFTHAPASLAWIDGDLIATLVAAGSAMFEWGLRLALPLLSASLIINVCLALVARFAPDFNILFLSLPVRLSAGLAVFGVVLRYAGSMFDRIIDGMLGATEAIAG